MTPKEFIRSRLRKIFDSVKSINIKYEYLEREDTHLIEVTPFAEFQDNSTYVEMERDLLFDFNDQFFPSTIIFVSEGSLNRVTAPELSLQMISVEICFTKQTTWQSNLDDSCVDCGENNYALAA